MRKCKQLLLCHFPRFCLVVSVAMFVLLLYRTHFRPGNRTAKSIFREDNDFNPHIKVHREDNHEMNYQFIQEDHFDLLKSTEHINLSASSQLAKKIAHQTVTTKLTKRRGLSQVLENVRTCLSATNMAEEANESIALANAQEFYRQYRELIPTEFLPDYGSHCWKTNFSIEISKGFFAKGLLGEYPLSWRMIGAQQTLLDSFSFLKQHFRGKFSSNVICLPKVFLAGFPKCGSTYAFCFLQSLVHASTGLRMGALTEVVKEPHFWVRVRVTKLVKMPKPADLGEYLLNFLPSLFKINEQQNKKVTLIDGTPNMLFDWPRFDDRQPNASNYCLLPSALPELLPDSKFIFIMRNPLKMLYSAFWFSCFTKGIIVPRQIQLLGPTLFHDRIRAKIDMFNDCMRDPNNLEISEPCTLSEDSDYDSCITKRLHLLEHCVWRISFNLFSKELPECGRSRVEMGIYYNHLRKLLTVVPRDKVLAITLEQLVAEPGVVAKRMLEFLGFPAPESILDQVELITLTCTKNSQEAIPYKHDPELKMKDETRTMILKFFKPFNSLLADLLGDDKFLWNI